MSHVWNLQFKICAQILFFYFSNNFHIHSWRLPIQNYELNCSCVCTKITWPNFILFDFLLWEQIKIRFFSKIKKKKKCISKISFSSLFLIWKAWKVIIFFLISFITKQEKKTHCKILQQQQRFSFVQHLFQFLFSGSILNFNDALDANTAQQRKCNQNHIITIKIKLDGIKNKKKKMSYYSCNCFMNKNKMKI